MNRGLSVDGEPVHWETRLDSPRYTEHCLTCTAALFCTTGNMFCLILCHANCGRVMEVAYDPVFVRVGMALPVACWGLSGHDKDNDLNRELVDSVLRCVQRGNFGTRDSYSSGQCLPCFEAQIANRLKSEDLASRGRNSWKTVYAEELSFVKEPADPIGRKGKK